MMISANTKSRDKKHKAEKPVAPPATPLAPVPLEPPTPPADTRTLGQFLKAEREGRQFTLKKISHRTKISITLLENLEEDRLDQLPSRAYVSGFVKSYAQVLGIPQEVCLGHLERMYGGPKPQGPKKKITAFDGPASTTVNMELIKVGLSALGILMIIAGVVLGIRSVNQRREEAKAQRTVTPQTITHRTPLKLSARHSLPEEKKRVAPLMGAQNKAHAVALDPAPVPALPAEALAKAGPAPAPVPVPVVEKKPIINETEFKDIDGPMYAMASEKDSDKMKELLPGNIKAAIVPGIQNVFINAHAGDTWITYKTDGAPIKKFVLTQGKTLLIRGKEVRMFLGNVGATKIFLNNHLLDLHTNSGVKSLVFPLENESKYKLPLFVFKKDSGEVIASDDYLKMN